MTTQKYILSLVFSSLLIVSCKKPNKFVPDNKAPKYYGIATVKVKNYVNRLFIDLVGREPLDTEMDSLVNLMETNNLNFATRDAIITNLQNDTTIQPNGDSFKFLYFERIYELQKARFVEGVPDVDFTQRKGNLVFAARQDSIYGNMLEYQYKMNQAQLYQDVIDARTDYMNDSISFSQVCLRMCYNGIYDQINMNSFNYINAVFDNTFYRFPTQSEFNKSYNMVEHNQADILFGVSGTSKLDFITIAVNSAAFIDGTVNWAYQSFLARNPNPQESYTYSEHYELNKNLHYIIKEIVKTDEYANF